MINKSRFRIRGIRSEFICVFVWFSRCWECSPDEVSSNKVLDEKHSDIQINTPSLNASDASQSVFGFAAGPDSDRVSLLRRGAVVCVWPNGLPPAVCGAPFRPVRDERRGDCS